ncbi:MAG TPA: hypothetical protein DCL38_11070, partial [Lachnospiraceae bacterium]|nr:hypothetical protein [Lachnospiraceae bacterium]
MTLVHPTPMLAKSAAISSGDILALGSAGAGGGAVAGSGFLAAAGSGFFAGAGSGFLAGSGSEAAA